MKKTFVLLLILALSFVGSARTVTHVPDKVGAFGHTIQSAWVIVETENSADTQTDALSDSAERTKLQLDALIAADAAQEGYISTFVIPAAWNGIRFRSINITKDSGTATHEIYFGTLGNEADCALTYAAQLAWTAGDQDSIYYQTAFTSGGSYIPQPGDIVTGNTSGETAVVMATPTPTSGTWAAGDAAGTIQYRSKSGTFGDDETVKIGDGKDAKANVLTHGGTSDLKLFEYADTLSLTQKSWVKKWGSISPADDTIAEATVDLMGADYMVIVTTTCTGDAKLLVKGY